ncbi:PTS mannose/fructose/sorbose/N-acetylgalactosamine transporter subunit IIC [Enterococcus raffinosus]
MKLVMSIIAGLWYWIGLSRPGYTLQNFIIQPLTMSVVFGLIYGDVKSALIIGAGIEMVYVGLVHTGVNVSVDECLAGVIAIPLALTLNLSAETAIALAVPFGLLGSLMDQLKRFINGYFTTLADKYAAEGNAKGIRNCAWVYPVIVGFFLRFPPAFIINFFGADLVQSALDSMPVWLTNGMSVAGGVLPALGFSISMIVIGKKNYIPFFIVGFFLIQYFEISIIGAAIFGVCISLLIVLLRRESNLKEGEA